MRHIIRETVYDVAERLRRKYKDFDHYNRKNPLNELIFIVCSIKTSEKRYRACYERLRLCYPRVEDLAKAPTKDIAKLIGDAGLSVQKARTIRNILEETRKRMGRYSLKGLNKFNDAECEKYLCELPGVGVKVARCVMMYSLGREVFPVDSHCWRVCRRIGWCEIMEGSNWPTIKQADVLQEKIPRELRFSLHVNMVSLGRDCCTPSNPKCDECTLHRTCPKDGVAYKKVNEQHKEGL